MSHAALPCFEGFARRFCETDAARAGAFVFGLSQKPYAHQGWRTLLLFVLFGCCSVLFFCVRWGRCRSGAADPMKAFGFARIRPARKTWKKFPRRFLRFLFEISQPLTPMETLVFVFFSVLFNCFAIFSVSVFFVFGMF